VRPVPRGRGYKVSEVFGHECYKVLKGRVAERTRDLIRQICEARDVVIVRGAVSPDHVHMLLSAPPDLSPSKLVQYI